MTRRIGKYYTPREIIDPAAGSGKFLSILSNPPYGTRHSARRRMNAISSVCFTIIAAAPERI
jgi:hypothetical protein